MRKLLYLFILLPIFSFSQIGWGSLASNQAVSWTDLQNAISTGVFAWGGTTLPSSYQCIYKDLATISNYAQVTLNGSRANTDLLLKSDFTANYTTTWDLSSVLSSDWQGYSSSSVACSAGTTATVAVVTFNGTATTGTRIALQSPVNVLDLGGGSTSYYPNITTGGWVQMALDGNGYYINSMGTCVTAPYYTNSSGTYPNNNPYSGSTTSGNIYNYSGSTIYVYGIYSASSTVTYSADYYWGTYEHLGGTGSGIIHTTAYTSVANGSSLSVSLTKQDNNSGGSFALWGWSSTIGGSITLF